jgi:hypothetical protein
MNFRLKMCYFKICFPLLSLASISAAADPDAVYDGGHNSTNYSILLNIGNGGAGQSGLVKGSST